MSITALKKLAASSKATVMVGLLAILGVLLYLNRIDAAQFVDAVKIVVPAWFIAHAGERGAAAMGRAKAVAIELLTAEVGTVLPPIDGSDEEEE